jgi:hypothetical protein
LTFGWLAMAMPVSAITGRRLALLIATSDYGDPALRKLRAPGRDASELAVVLSDPQIGSFEVQTLINAPSGEVQEKIGEFCADRRSDDQLLIYLSCHGVLDDSGRLYYAATNTRRQREAATAVAATWLNERLDDCRARRQIIVLDCCHSGAFAGRAKGDADLALQQRFRPHSRGRVVLTASRSTEYSFEGGQVSGEGVQSVFTRAIVDGLRTGDADRDKDGLITVTDLYNYVSDKVWLAEPRQSPELWLYAAEGDLLVAHSIRGAVIEPAALPEDLRVTLESPGLRVRETGVTELAELLDKAEPGLALTARQALQRIADEDLPKVAAVARAALGASAGTAADQVGRELAERSRRDEQARREAGEKAKQAEEQARRQARKKARQAEEQARRQAESQTAPARSAGPQRQPDSGTRAHADSPGLAAGLAPSRSMMKGWRARRSLPLLIVVSAMTVVVLAGIRIISSAQSLMAYQRVEQLANLSGKTIGLVQALQNEREDTVSYIVLGSAFGGRGASKAGAAPELAVLKKDYAVSTGWAGQASALLRQVGSSYPSLTQQDAASSLTAISGLADIRGAATHSKLPALVVVQEYANSIDTLLALDSQVAVGSNDGTLADTVRVASLISAMKEEASEQQAILTSALAPGLAGLGQFGASQQSAITNAQAEQQGDLAEYNSVATSAQAQLYHNATSGTTVSNAAQQEQQAISAAASGASSAAAGGVNSTTGLAVENAVAATSYLVSSLRSVEEQLVASTISRATALHNGAIISEIADGILLIVMALLFTTVLRPPMARLLQRGHHVLRNRVRGRGLSSEETSDRN